MKTYQCHKQVRAAKIIGIEDILAGRNTKTCTLRLDDGTTRQVDFGWTWKHEAKVGTYLVEYDDGYLSCSPAAAFEAGYAPVKS